MGESTGKPGQLNTSRDAFVLCEASGRVVSWSAGFEPPLRPVELGYLDQIRRTASERALEVERIADVEGDGGVHLSLHRISAGAASRAEGAGLTPDLIMVVRSGRIALVDRRGAALLGAADPSELVNSPLRDLLALGVEDPLLEAVERMSHEPVTMSLSKTKLRTRNTVDLHLDFVGLSLGQEDDRGALLIARESAGEAGRQSALQDSLTLLESTLDSTADAIVVMDCSQKVVFHNSRFATLVGEKDPGRFIERLMELVANNSRLQRHLPPEQSQGADLRDEMRLVDDRIIEVTSVAWRQADRVVGRVLSFRDITERRRSEEGLVRREQILQAVAFAAERFLTREWPASVSDVLRRLGQTTRVSRVYLFENHLDERGRELWSQRAEWAAPGISPEIDNPDLQNLPVDELFADWQRMLQEGEIVNSLVRDLPSPRRELMESQHILSMMLVPITVERQLWGFLGFDDCTWERVWTSLEIDALRIAARILAGALQKRAVQEALRRSEERYRNLFEKNLAGVYRNTLSGRVLDCNDACARIFGYANREELLRTDANALYFEPAQREEVVDHLRRAGTLSNAEICLRRRDGRLIWVLENITLREEGGEEVMEGTIIDITDRKRMEEALRESEERYRLMADSTTDIISRHTADGIFLYASPASRTLLGLEPYELVGRSLPQLVHPEDAGELQRVMEALQSSTGDHVSRFRLRRRDGHWVWFEGTSRMIRNLQSGDVQEIISVLRDISERKRAEERIAHQASHDALTGLPNRSLFGDRLLMALARARRTGRGVAVIFLDLDFFKEINDSFGHAAGDRLLQEVGARLRNSVREEDTVARIGGDEFLLLLGELQDPADARRLAEKIRYALDSPVEVTGRLFQTSASLGVAIFPADGDDPETLLEAADRAMYAAKSHGRNTVQLSSDVAASRG